MASGWGGICRELQQEAKASRELCRAVEDADRCRTPSTPDPCVDDDLFNSSQQSIPQCPQTSDAVWLHLSWPILWRFNNDVFSAELALRCRYGGCSG